jgi:hypothetical protein
MDVNSDSDIPAFRRYATIVTAVHATIFCDLQYFLCAVCETNLEICKRLYHSEYVHIAVVWIQLYFIVVFINILSLAKYFSTSRSCKQLHDY